MVYSNTFITIIVWTTLISASYSDPPGCYQGNDLSEVYVSMKCSNLSLVLDSPEQNLEINKLNRTNLRAISFYNVNGYFDSKLLENFTDLRVLVVVENHFKTFKLKSNIVEQLMVIRTNVEEGSTLANCCSRLEKLSLKSNKGFNFELTGFNGLKRLKNLDITLQEIKHITRDTFKGLNKLKTLSMINCSIETIAEGSFDDLHNLRELYIEDNSLRRIDQKAFESLKQLNSLIIYGENLDPLSLKMFSEQKKLMQIGLPLNTWRTIDVEEMPDMFPRLNFFSYIGKFKSDRDRHDTKRRVFSKLTRLLINRDQNT